MKKLVVVLFLGSMLSWSGCGQPGPELGSEGTYGGPCRDDGSCDEGLKCVYRVCKEG